MQLVVTRDGVGRLEEGGIALLDSAFPDVAALLRGAGSLDLLAAARVLDRVPLEGCELRAPVGGSSAVWGVGLNYHSKAARAGRAVPVEPILYLAASSAVVGPDAEVTVPVERTAEMDYEGEIAVVIGQPLYQAEPSAVWPAVAGITAANDITARDVMRATGSPTLAKSFPGFNPLGASFVTVDELPDRDAIGVRTFVNGELRQAGDSSGMIFAIPELVARLSHLVALEPGDIVLTGTPAGTGQDRQCFLAAGDEIRVEVDSVLPLVTTVAGLITELAPTPVLAEQAR
ncbi:MAG TPA: fumarylacetoacetate hydrolase family protein [Jatrophihabitantaceae bacterium]|nr:fumarylacetoacetate hydrolase family protein [Jatrophihabitantaceae bacterium]